MPTSIVDTVLLLASELVVNAATHPAMPALLRAECSAGQVRVAVTDAGPGLPVVHDSPNPFEPDDRGLLIVDQFATRWGVDPQPTGGKTTWFEVSYRPIVG